SLRRRGGRRAGFVPHEVGEGGAGCIRGDTGLPGPAGRPLPRFAGPLPPSLRSGGQRGTSFVPHEVGEGPCPAERQRSRGGRGQAERRVLPDPFGVPPYPASRGPLPPSLRSGGQRGAGFVPPEVGEGPCPAERQRSRGGRGHVLRRALPDPFGVPPPPLRGAPSPLASLRGTKGDKLCPPRSGGRSLPGGAPAEPGGGLPGPAGRPFPPRFARGTKPHSLLTS